MLAASLPSPGSLTLVRRPLPILGPRDVLLSVEATTLCGTDLRIVTGQKTHGVTPGVILGHEIAARVWKLGADLRPGIDAPAPGTQVGLAPEITCGHCVPCTAGRSSVCANMAFFGTGVDGGLADVIRVPERALACITPSACEIAPPLLALAEPLSCCLRARTRLPITSTSRVLILGTGPIGLIHCALAAAAGASVMACGRPARLDPALALGASTVTAAHGDGLVATVRYRELTISGSANATLEDYTAAVATLSTGALDLSPLITHEFPLTQVEAALDAVRSRAGLKVVVCPGRGKPTEC